MLGCIGSGVLYAVKDCGDLLEKTQAQQMCQERIWKLIVFNYVLRPPAIPGGFCASLKIKKLTSNIKKKHLVNATAHQT